MAVHDFGLALRPGEVLGLLGPNGAGRLSMPYATREIEAAQSAANAAPAAYNSDAHAFVSMGVQFILMASIDMALGLLLASRLGLWKRLRAAWVPAFMVFAVWRFRWQA